MGSCISKSKPKKTSKKRQSKQDDHCKCQCNEKNHTTNKTPLVQDKLVITQAPTSSISSESANSTCTKTSYTITNSSSSSCSLLSSASSLASSASIISSKSVQSFSNDEFLWSCVKRNPQILRADYLPIKVSNNRRASLPTRGNTSGRKPSGLKELTGPSPQRIVVRSTAQKRPRSNSPSNLTRQKSFRREPEVEHNMPISRSGSDLRPMSPSSSRRFSGELSNRGRSLTSSMRRENCYIRPQSPSNSKSCSGNSNSRRVNGYGRSNNLLVKREKEDVIKGVKELTMGDLASTQNMELMPIEDGDNPHIALDCFIFL